MFSHQAQHRLLLQTRTPSGSANSCSASPTQHRVQELSKLHDRGWREAEETKIDLGKEEVDHTEEVGRAISAVAMKKPKHDTY